MSSDAVVELPPFKRCFNASISFFNASSSLGLLLLKKVVANRGRHKIDRETDDEAHAAGYFNARDDGPVRG